MEVGRYEGKMYSDTQIKVRMMCLDVFARFTHISIYFLCLFWSLYYVQRAYACGRFLLITMMELLIVAWFLAFVEGGEITTLFFKCESSISSHNYLA